MFYLFHHVPKTAGTSCNEAFGSMFHVVKDYHRSIKESDLIEYKRAKKVL